MMPSLFTIICATSFLFVSSPSIADGVKDIKFWYKIYPVLARHISTAQCNPDISVNPSDLLLSNTLVDNRSGQCAAWLIPQTEIIAVSTKILLKGKSIPVVVYFRANSSKKLFSAVTDVYLNLVGGPGGTIAPKKSDKIFAGILDNNSIIISVGYAGTSYRNFYPDESFSKAVNDVEDIYSRLKIADPRNSVSLLGESLGGLVAVSAALKLQETGKHIKRVLILNPVSFSPNEAIRNFQTVLRNTKENDTNINVALVKKVGDMECCRNFTQVSTAELFRSFFPKSQMKFDITYFLSKIIDTPVGILFGNDDLVSGAPLKLLHYRQQNVHISNLRNFGHFVTDDKIEDVCIAMHALRLKL